MQLDTSGESGHFGSFFVVPALPAQRFYSLAMTLKAIIQKIASWFKSEAKTVEHDGIRLFDQLGNEVWSLTRDGTVKITPIQPQQDTTAMSTPAAPTGTATASAATGNNVNTAVQIALALKSIDASLSVEAVQAATNAALAAAYPAAAAA